MLLLNLKLLLSSNILLVKMALIFCCIKQFSFGATLANDSFKKTLMSIFKDNNAAGVKLTLTGAEREVRRL